MVQKALDNYDLEADQSLQTAQVLSNMGWIYEELKEWRKAESCYEKIIKFYTKRGYAEDDIACKNTIENARKKIKEIRRKHPSKSELIAMTKDPKRRIYALEKLVKMDKEKYLPLLVKALIEELENGVGDDRWNAALQLGKIGDKSAVPSLIRVLKDKKDSVLKKEAAEALARIGDRRAIPALVEALKDQFVQREAAIALGKMRDRSGLPHILWVLKNYSDWRYRRDAARILSNIGDKSVMPYLKKALRDKNKEVREAAKKAIEKIKERYSK